MEVESASSEPSSYYRRAKRWTLVLSGVLVMSILVGIEPNKNSSFFPFQLTNTRYLSDCVAIALTFFLYQTLLHWPAQSSEVQTLNQFRIDHRLSIWVGAVSLGLWLKTWLLLGLSWILHKPPGSEPISEIASRVFVSDILLFAIGLLFVWLFIQFIQRRAETQVREREEEMIDKERQILNLLRNDIWVLIFNANKKSGLKHIEFGDDGIITKGDNENETSWRVRGEFLEIFRANGELQSRFRYNESKGMFEHTNDEDTRSLRGQMIVREDAIPPGFTMPGVV